MLEEVERLVREYASGRRHGQPGQLTLTGTDCWTLDCTFPLSDDEECRIRTLEPGDENQLRLFGERLSAGSKGLFNPYPWNDESELAGALKRAVEQSVQKVDLSFIMLCNGLPIGNFFLWKAGGNAHSRAHGVQVPELGVAVADRYHGRGLGTLSVRLLVAMARSLGADAVELTTAFENSAGWNTYLKTGFEYVGNIRTPQGVDVTAAMLGQVRASEYRDERQMVHILQPARRDEVLQYLAAKRAESV